MNLCLKDLKKWGYKTYFIGEGANNSVYKIVKDDAVYAVSERADSEEVEHFKNISKLVETGVCQLSIVLLFVNMQRLQER